MLFVNFICSLLFVAFQLIAARDIRTYEVNNSTKYFLCEIGFIGPNAVICSKEMVPMRDGVKLHTRIALPRDYVGMIHPFF